MGVPRRVARAVGTVAATGVNPVWGTLAVGATANAEMNEAGQRRAAELQSQADRDAANAEAQAGADKIENARKARQSYIDTARDNQGRAATILTDFTQRNSVL